MFKKLITVLVVAGILLASAFSVYAMGFDAETVYGSVFVVSTYNSLGSGFAIGKNIIITNEHVIKGAEAVSISSYSGKAYKAKVYAADSRLDLAILTVEGADFVPLAIGDDSLAKIGEDIYTIGAPNSMAYTLTKGVISAKDRKVSGQTYIQIDAAINSGNSGGPLLNDSGEVLGINTLKMSDSDGIGLSIPISRAVEYIESCGIAFDDNNVASIVESTTEESTQNEQPQTAPQEDGDDELVPSENIEKYKKTNSVLVVALALSVCVNIAFIIYIVYKNNGNKYVTAIDPSERTDFEIEIEE